MAVLSRLIIVIGISVLSCSPGLMSVAQSPVYDFRHITTREGLTGDDVKDITQDDRGFMWFATANGLQKYDGYSFTNYHYDPADPQSLSSDEIACLLQDGAGGMWVLTSGGNNKLDLLTGKNTRMDELNTPELKKLNYLVSACRDEQGNAWFIAGNSLGRYDAHTRRMVSCDGVLPTTDGQSIAFTRMILPDRRNHCLWINSARWGVCMYDPSRNAFYYRMHNPRNLPVLSIPRTAGTIFLDRENHLWVNTYRGELYRFDLAGGGVEKYDLGADGSLRGAEGSIRGDTLFTRESVNERGSVHGHDAARSPGPGKRSEIYTDCFLEDKEGTIWIGARNYGLLQYCPEADSFRMIRRNITEPGSLEYEEGIHCLYEDRESNIWIGTDKGINVFNPYVPQFISTREEPARKPDSRKHSFMSFLETACGDIWATAYEVGIEVYDPQFRFKKNYVYDPVDPYALKEPANRPWSFLNHPDGTIWVGSQGGWLSTYDPVAGRFTGSAPLPALGKNSILKMVADKEQNTWMALYSGIARWDARTHAVTRYADFLSDQSSTVTQADDIAVDGQGDLWVATLTLGLQKFDPALGRFTEIYVPEKNNPHSIVSRTVLCVINMNDSVLALGTSEGIDLFNKRSRQFSPVHSPAGLPVHSVAALYLQNPDALWEATNQGIYKVSLGDGRVTSYGLEDGIIDNDFSDCMQFYRMRDGRLLVGCKGGFVRFNPDSIRDRPAPADVNITGCAIDGQPIPIDSILTRTDTVPLSYKENVIAIQYASLSYRDMGGTTYAYRLDGVDRNWIHAGTQRFASYSNLAPGAYTFSVKCQNRDGISCARVTDLVFLIHPPFWQTWWFRALILATIVLLLYGFYRYRINQLMALQAVRNRISKDIHDDVGATLSSISILSEMARNNIEQGRQEQSYSLLTKISSHSREMVENMSDIIWSIKPANDNIEHIIGRLRHFALETCAATDIRLQFTAEEKTLRMTLSMEQTKNTYLICKEAVNNAIKHARCRRITVAFAPYPGGLELSIADDGIGFDPQPGRPGNGMQNMDSRAREIKGSLVVRSVRGNTRLQVRFPIT